MSRTDAHDESVGREQAGRLKAILDTAGIDRQQFWLRYFSIGGGVSPFEVDAYLHHSLLLPRLQRDLLAQAANELLAEVRPPRAPFASDVMDHDDGDGTDD